MKKVGQVCKWFIAVCGILGITLLTSCEGSSADDIVVLMVENQTGEPLGMYLDNSDKPELTVAAHANQTLVFDTGAHQVKWQGATISGLVAVTIPKGETKTLTIWGSGNAYSLK